jgi:2'-5' RNA ligase
MPTERRLFVGIFPPVEVARLVHEAARKVLPEKDFRIVPADEIHLTLRFFGATPEPAIPGIAVSLAAALRGSRRPALRIRGAGAFPDADSARVLWAGLEDAGDRLAHLAASVGEVKPFHPHLTVARCRNARAPEAFLDLSIDLPWTPSEVLLVESRPGAAGPDRFPRIEAFPLSPESP